MADDEVTPQAGELVTTNYGWIKPTVGSSDDAWGGYINGDLDGIDTTVKSVSTVANAAYPASNPTGYITAAAVPVASSTTPVMDGTAAVGVGTTWARGDHKHPSDTTKYDASNPTGYITSAAVPVASSTTPLVDGTAAVGTGTTWARADHVHPLPPQAIGDNRIINGDMRIDQRNNGASGTANNVYTIDRWRYGANQASKGTWLRPTGAGVLTATGFPYYLQFISSSAYASLTGDAFYFQQRIEADMVSDFCWGTANAQPVTLSFWVNSTLSGTFGGAIQNDVPNRSYPFSFSIPVANTWTKITVTIPGDIAGTWVLSGNAVGVYVAFDLGSGATFRGSASAWAAGNLLGVTGATSVVGTNAAQFNVTGVKLEIGSVATPYNRQSLAKSMADCQRYYQTGNQQASGWAGGASIVISAQQLPFAVIMRAAPTMTPTWTTQNNGTGNLAPTNVGFYSVYNLTTAAGSISNVAGTFTANAEL